MQFAMILCNRLKFSTAQVYFITLCDGLKFADSTVDVTDDAQLTAHERNPGLTYGRRIFVWTATEGQKTAVGEDGCCDERCNSSFEFYKFEVASQIYSYVTQNTGI